MDATFDISIPDFNFDDVFFSEVPRFDATNALDSLPHIECDALDEILRNLDSVDSSKYGISDSIDMPSTPVHSPHYEPSPVPVVAAKPAAQVTVMAGDALDALFGNVHSAGSAIAPSTPLRERKLPASFFGPTSPSKQGPHSPVRSPASPRSPPERQAPASPRQRLGSLSASPSPSPNPSRRLSESVVANPLPAGTARRGSRSLAPGWEPAQTSEGVSYFVK